MPILARNKKAFYDYEILEKYEAGLVLTGSEVKAVRLGNINLKGAYVVLQHESAHPTAQLINCHIGQYPYATSMHVPDRSRTLLLNKREFISLSGKTSQKGLTLIPLSVYTRGSLLKLEFAVAKGKKNYEKRESIKKRDTERDMRKIMRRK